MPVVANSPVSRQPPGTMVASLRGSRRWIRPLLRRNATRPVRILVVRVSGYGTVPCLAHQARQKSDRYHKDQGKKFHVILDNNTGFGVAVESLISSLTTWRASFKFMRAPLPWLAGRFCRRCLPRSRPCGRRWRVGRSRCRRSTSAVPGSR
jgi:hypothetical protein